MYAQKNDDNAAKDFDVSATSLNVQCSDDPT